MEGLFAAGGVVWLVLFIVCRCIAIALKVGVDTEEIRSVLNGG